MNQQTDADYSVVRQNNFERAFCSQNLDVLLLNRNNNIILKMILRRFLIEKHQQQQQHKQTANYHIF